jgi:hypothetical protein
MRALSNGGKQFHSAAHGHNGVDSADEEPSEWRMGMEQMDGQERDGRPNDRSARTGRGGDEGRGALTHKRLTQQRDRRLSAAIPILHAGTSRKRTDQMRQTTKMDGEEKSAAPQPDRGQRRRQQRRTIQKRRGSALGYTQTDRAPSPLSHVRWAARASDGAAKPSAGAQFVDGSGSSEAQHSAQAHCVL